MLIKKNFMLNNVPEITVMKSENKKFKVIFRVILQDYLYPKGIFGHCCFSSPLTSEFRLDFPNSIVNLRDDLLALF